MSTLRLNARLAEAQARQVQELCAITGQTTSEVIRAAILHYHGTFSDRASEPHRVLVAIGFIGCGSAEPELSESYKAALTHELAAKHGHR